MTKTSYFTCWAGIYILCAGLGFIPEPTGFLRFLLIALSVAFFIPPAFLLYQAKQTGDRPTAVLIRSLAAGSLVLTLVLILANFLSLMAPQALGNVLYAALVIASAPMVCGQYWVLGLFGWACLLMTSLSILKRKNRTA